jgi:hypothetical protein
MDIVSGGDDDESSTDAGGGFVMAETVGHYIDEHGNQVPQVTNLVFFQIFVTYTVDMLITFY